VFVREADFFIFPACFTAFIRLLPMTSSVFIARALSLAATVTLAMAGGAALAQPVVVTDDQGTRIELPHEAKRIIALAPHVVELIFAAGGGDRIVGTVLHADYPPAARDIAQIGDNRALDIERIIALRPDVMIAWRHGNAESHLEPLRKLGIPLFYSEPHTLEDVATSMEKVGQMMGTEAVAKPAAQAFRARIAALSAKYRDRPPVRLFYQVWDQPLYTLNRTHILNDALGVCGGVNIFGDLPATAPTVSIEAVLAADPEAVIAGAREGRSGTGPQVWKQYPTLLATKRDNLFDIVPDLILRAGPRIVEGTEQLCEKLETARTRRPAQ
jgi:iron complex transport system substrate-binding protein